MMDDRWTDRLSEYLDGDLAGPECAGMEAHLATCADCRCILDELRGVVRSAAALPDEPPDRDLWAGVESRLEARGAGAKVISMAERRRHFSFTLPQLAAAGVLLMAASSGLVWVLLNGTGRSSSAPVASAPAPAGSVAASAPRTSAPAPLVATDSAAHANPGQMAPDRSPALASGPAERRTPEPSVRPDESSRRVLASGLENRSEKARLVRSGSVRTLSPQARATRDYNRAVADLESVLRQERSRLRPETVKALESSLADIDRAISDARRALARDPANVYLNAHLAESMRLKLELLQQATTITQS